MTLASLATTLSIVGTGGQRRLIVESSSNELLDSFEGKVASPGVLEGPLSPENARSARNAFPHLAPQPVGLSTSAGTGDRLGLATPGHVAAFQQSGTHLVPVFAQQSAREMDRVGRDPRAIIDDATFGAIEGGWEGRTAADADHLKSTADIDRFLAAGFTSFTLDPGDVVHHLEGVAEQADLKALPWEELEDSYDALLARYENLNVDTGETNIALSSEDLLTAAAKYGRCVALAVKMYRHLVEKADREVEVEIAVDETADVTTPAEHVYFVTELNRLGVRFTGFAPRYIGEFEKGVEYIGDIQVLEDSLRVHAGIARALGPYKLSLHSGSDKFSIYDVVAQTTGGLVHLKTSGTSWLTALDVVVAHEPDVFREIYTVSRNAYVNARESYPVSADPKDVPPAEAVADAHLPELLSSVGTRQVLHVGYGDVLGVSDLDQQIRQILAAEAGEYRDRLRRHIGRHLRPFNDRAVRA